MDQADLVEMIGDMLTELDGQLVSPELNADQAKWTQVYALRKHLDDQQRELVKKTIDADDMAFKVNSGLIDAAKTQLEGVLGQMTKIDAAINIVSQVCASLDKILEAI